MPTTYTKIALVTLGSNQTTVTISSIPQTFTNLLLKCNMRGTTSSSYQSINMTFNGDGSNVYSMTGIQSIAAAGDTIGITAGVGSSSSITNGSTANAAVANTYSITDISILNYISTSLAKQITINSITENNTNNANITQQAHCFNSTNAISSISFTPSSGQFATGSTFYLYGLVNS
jgi:hypothetical protein